MLACLSEVGLSFDASLMLSSGGGGGGEGEQGEGRRQNLCLLQQPATKLQRASERVNKVRPIQLAIQRLNCREVVEQRRNTN